MGSCIAKPVLGLALGLAVLTAGRCRADEAMLSPVLTKISSTTLSGYVDVTGTWKLGTGDCVMPGRDFTTPSDLTVVPEPSVMALASVGAAAVFFRRRGSKSN